MSKLLKFFIAVAFLSVIVWAYTSGEIRSPFDDEVQRPIKLIDFE